MMSESSALLRSCKDLVAEAYKYFESLADVATHISLAVALVDICGCLMKHSTSFTEQSKERQGNKAKSIKESFINLKSNIHCSTNGVWISVP